MRGRRVYQNPSYNAVLSRTLLRGRRHGSSDAVGDGHGVSLVRQTCLPTCNEEAMAVKCGLWTYSGVLRARRQVDGG